MKPKSSQEVNSEHLIGRWVKIPHKDKVVALSVCFCAHADPDGGGFLFGPESWL
jgi:hypothetical protein